jgi:hypothetical protein
MMDMVIKVEFVFLKIHLRLLRASERSMLMIMSKPLLGDQRLTRTRRSGKRPRLFSR